MKDVEVPLGLCQSGSGQECMLALPIHRDSSRGSEAHGFVLQGTADCIIRRWLQSASVVPSGVAVCS